MPATLLNRRCHRLVSLASLPGLVVGKNRKSENTGHDDSAMHARTHRSTDAAVLPSRSAVPDDHNAKACPGNRSPRSK